MISFFFLLFYLIRIPNTLFWRHLCRHLPEPYIVIYTIFQQFISFLLNIFILSYHWVFLWIKLCSPVKLREEIFNYFLNFIFCSISRLVIIILRWFQIDKLIVLSQKHLLNILPAYFLQQTILSLLDEWSIFDWFLSSISTCNNQWPPIRLLGSRTVKHKDDVDSGEDSEESQIDSTEETRELDRVMAQPPHIIVQGSRLRRHPGPVTEIHHDLQQFWSPVNKLRIKPKEDK